MKLCHCGRPLHYNSPAVQRIVEALVADRGEYITVHARGRSWSVPRHYIALHGLNAEDVESLGFEECRP